MQFKSNTSKFSAIFDCFVVVTDCSDAEMLRSGDFCADRWRQTEMISLPLTHAHGIIANAGLLFGRRIYDTTGSAPRNLNYLHVSLHLLSVRRFIPQTTQDDWQTCCHSQLVETCKQVLVFQYTFSSGGRNSTVDFCFIDCWAAQLVLECGVQERHPLNLADYFSLKKRLNCKPQLLTHKNNNQKLNWRKASHDGSIGNYQDKVSSNLSPIIEHPLMSITEVARWRETSVVSLLLQAVAATIPTFRHKYKAKNFIPDELDKQVSMEKVVWWWSA